MKKNVIIINGSCREGGNTDMLLKSLEKGAACADININKHILRKKSINDCNGCYYCYKNSNCSIKDDMQEIHHEIQKSDLIILASPMYWWGVTGLMKTFIDRLYLYFPKRNKHFVAGKKLLFIIPLNVNEKQHGREAYISEIEPIQMTSKYIFERLGIEIIDIVFYPGLSAKGDASKNKEYLNNSYKLGQKLDHLY
ncbi:MAG: flavodoxin family protein [Candidatus Lokiarchaeota archaeon]|nr:flavodoxin family protein [Candidatus Lokiarchaeota archaeon]